MSSHAPSTSEASHACTETSSFQKSSTSRQLCGNRLRLGQQSWGSSCATRDWLAVWAFLSGCPAQWKRLTEQGRQGVPLLGQQCLLSITDCSTITGARSSAQQSCANVQVHNSLFGQNLAKPRQRAKLPRNPPNSTQVPVQISLSRQEPRTTELADIATQHAADDDISWTARRYGPSRHKSRRCKMQTTETMKNTMASYQNWYKRWRRGRDWQAKTQICQASHLHTGVSGSPPIVADRGSSPWMGLRELASTPRRRRGSSPPSAVGGPPAPAACFRWCFPPHGQSVRSAMSMRLAVPTSR